MDIDQSRANQILLMAKSGMTEEEAKELLNEEEMWKFMFYKKQFDHWKEIGREDLIRSYSVPCE